MYFIVFFISKTRRGASFANETTIHQKSDDVVVTMAWLYYLMAMDNLTNYCIFFRPLNDTCIPVFKYFSVNSTGQITKKLFKKEIQFSSNIEQILCTFMVFFCNVQLQRSMTFMMNPVLSR